MPMIIGEIRRYLRDNSTLRVSRSLRDTAYRALQAKEAFVREHQREPDIVELARAMNVPKEEVVFALDAILDPVSLFEPVFHDGADTVCVMDQVGDTRNTDDHWLAAIALREAIDGLDDREKRIIRLRFFEGRTQMEVPLRFRSAIRRAPLRPPFLGLSGCIFKKFASPIFYIRDAFAARLRHRSTPRRPFFPAFSQLPPPLP